MTKGTIFEEKYWAMPTIRMVAGGDLTPTNDTFRIEEYNDGHQAQNPLILKDRDIKTSDDFAYIPSTTIVECVHTNDMGGAGYIPRSNIKKNSIDMSGGYTEKQSSVLVIPANYLSGHNLPYQIALAHLENQGNILIMPGKVEPNQKFISNIIALEALGSVDTEKENWNEYDPDALFDVQETWFTDCILFMVGRSYNFFYNFIIILKKRYFLLF